MDNRWLRRLICAGIAIAIALPSPDLGEAPTLAKPKVERDRFGIDVHQYERSGHIFQRRETLAMVLRKYEVPLPRAAQVGPVSEAVFDSRKIRAGSAINVYSDISSGRAEMFVYQPEPTRYVVYDFRDSVSVYQGFIEPAVTRRTAHGTISASLFEAMHDINVDGTLAVEMSRIFAWQIDFRHLQKGDEFSLLYDETHIDEDVIGVDILAARLLHNGQEYTAYAFEAHDGAIGFYDEDGNSVKRQFLRAPLEYSRISSRFSHRRFHPIQKRYKPHFGTDFAAPYGTPIVATADGEVVAAGYDSGNGRYVKLRHNGTYSTGYLHMSRIAVQRGQRVQQGEVIGYVGSTGLATGPHVCYRFWENGQPVDPLTLDLPPSTPISDENRESFEQQRDAYRVRLTR